ncbi:MAG: hypothetical protein LBD55_05820 [Treponema sp.]|jgi:hypothetical protein|nr:hypothetical protein [Treponema sp.]
MPFGDMFYAVQTADNGGEELRKALQAGYGTDAAQFAGGRTLQPESMELTMLMAMREQPEDCKLMNQIARRPVSSTVHQYNVRTEAGADYQFLTAGEGGEANATDQDIKRIYKDIKYLQTYRSVTDQMLAVESFESALAAEKMAGTLTILKAAEYLCFHGDSGVNSTEYDGLIKVITDNRGKPAEANAVDLRGRSIGTAGRRFFDEPAERIYQAGGDCNILYFPPPLAADIQELAVGDSVRYIGNMSLKPDGGNAATAVADHFTTPFGNRINFGESCGADNFFRVKGKTEASGNVQTRSAAPTAALAAQAGVSGSLFLAAQAGTYQYAARGINRFGISTASTAASVAVAANGGAVITITPSPTGLETGYIITRSEKDGSNLMEMKRIPRDTQNPETVYTDKNEDLPGTAEALWLTEKRLQTILEFYQLIPLHYRPLYENKTAEKPFLIQLFGAADLKVPTFCAVTKNIQYRGGLVY